MWDATHSFSPFIGWTIISHWHEYRAKRKCKNGGMLSYWCSVLGIMGLRTYQDYLSWKSTNQSAAFCHPRITVPGIYNSVRTLSVISWTQKEKKKNIQKLCMITFPLTHCFQCKKVGLMKGCIYSSGSYCFENAITLIIIIISNSTGSLLKWPPYKGATLLQEPHMKIFP